MSWKYQLQMHVKLVAKRGHRITHLWSPPDVGMCVHIEILRQLLSQCISWMSLKLLAFYWKVNCMHLILKELKQETEWNER